MNKSRAIHAKTNHIDCFTAWGLAAGEHAFYAESLGQLYLFLTGAFLDHIRKDDIQDVLIINFHVGLNCGGEYDVFTETGTVKKEFAVSLTKPDDPNSPGLVQKIGALQKKGGRFTLAVCSAAVVVESYALAEPEMRRFMSRDYDPDKMLKFPQLEVHVMKRLAPLALDKSNLKLRVFHTAADLPLTALFLRFSRPIMPSLPTGTLVKRRRAKGGKKVTEMLATGLFEPRFATDVAQQKRDINLPVQILVAGTSASDARIRGQIKSLVDVYCKVIKQNAVPPKDPEAGPDTVHIFIAHYGEDTDLARALKAQIESFATGKALRCNCILGVGEEMLQPGRSILQNLNELTRLIDYAIVLYPSKRISRHNIPYELGVFSQRFVTRDSTNQTISSRATLVAKPSKVVRELSDWSGIPIVDRPRGKPKKVADKLFHSLAAKIHFFNT